MAKKKEISIEKCQGNLREHLWMLKNEYTAPFTIGETKRSFFKKEIIGANRYPYDYTIKPNKIVRSWYCSSCRKLETTYEIIGKPRDYWLEMGYSVDGEMPRLTNKEYKKKRNKQLDNKI